MTVLKNLSILTRPLFYELKKAMINHKEQKKMDTGF